MLFKVWDLRFYCNQEFWLPDAEILNLKEFKVKSLAGGYKGPVLKEDIFKRNVT